MSRVKRIQSILLIISILFLSVVVITDATAKQTKLSNLMLSEEHYENIKSARQSTSNQIIRADIKFNDYLLFADYNTSTYYYSAIENHTLAYNPTVSVESEQNIKIAFLNADITDETVKSGETVKFVLYTESDYAEYNLAVTKLPIISINLENEPKNKSNPITSDKEYVNAYFNVFDNSADANHINRVINSFGKIRLRGATSKGYDQKSYRFQLYNESVGSSLRNNNINLLGLRSDDDWIIYPAFNDPEKVRTNLSHDVWSAFGATNNDFGMNTGTKTKLCEVLINGRYWGLYTLMYPIDNNQFNLNENTTSGMPDYWYRAVGYEDATSNDFMSAKDDVSRVKRYEIRFPTDHSGLYYKKWQPLDNFNKVLETKDDDYFVEHLEDHLDLENQIDMWLFLKITQAVDNCSKNTNFVAKYRDGKYTILVSPWDLDQTWGLSWKTGVFTNTDVIIEPNDPINKYDFDMIISRCLELEMPNIARQIQERYTKIRSDILTDAQFDEWLNYYEAKVYSSGAAIRNAERWPRARKAEDMSDLRYRVKEHLKFMDSYIATLDTTFGEE
ncbi:MAG: CotH kinase family protein [Clostridia bacterium]|nr:CotH kinase family protein [Clostridia bacterium]